ncbi:hypothetical protein ACLI4Z_09270 [Natrialbaceae archaeon A-arb3/5]
MDVDWDRYQVSYPYRLCVSLHYLEKQSPRLKQRFFRAAKHRAKWNGLLLAGAFIFSWIFSSSVSVYGLAMVGAGATILAWTAFRVHEKAFREAALVPDDRKEDTSYQEQVTMTSLNYVDAAIGVALVASGFVVRFATSIG